MRLITFDHEGASRIGVRLGNELVDLSIAAPELPETMLGLITAGPEALDHAGIAAERAGSEARIPISEVKYRIPVEKPEKIASIGTNYIKHVKEMRPDFEEPPYPAMFFRMWRSMIAHEQPILRPRISDTLDYEGELALVIGKSGRYIPREKALDHVVAYTCHNDASIREYNRYHMGLSVGKNFEGTGALGPELVTADELPPGCKGLRLVTRVNGEVRQDEDLGNMHWDVAALIHFISQMIELSPGDIITTGTPRGVGAGFKPPKWLRAGDEVTVEIDGIGTLSNPVVNA